MVKITPEEVMAMRKGQRRPGEMPEAEGHTQALPAKRLTIPLADVSSLRRAAEMFQGLASEFDQLSRRETWPVRVALLEARAIIDDANRRLQVGGNAGAGRRRAAP